MLHQDYLVRMFVQLAAAIRQTFDKTQEHEDPETKANLLEASLMNATEIDGGLLLQLAPETMASMLQLSGTDPTLIGYVARTLLLESVYLKEAQQAALAQLRRNQAYALAEAYGFELSDVAIEPDALEEFFEESEKAY